MSNSHDNDDWSNDSASLFREARRAHDPTLAESTRLTAVLARIQAGKAEASFAANRGADIVARGATSAMLRLVAKVSLGVVCIAAVSFAFIRANSHPPEPALGATPAPTTSLIAPALRGGATSDSLIAPALRGGATSDSLIAPALRGGATSDSLIAPALRGGATSDSLIAPALRGGAISARDGAKSRPRSQGRRSRASAERQQTSRSEITPVPEASSSARADDSTSVAAPENSAPRQEQPVPSSAPRAVAVTQKAPPKAVTTAARKAAPTRPEQARTELAMMKRIQSALLDADFSTVLALCAEHARRWPHGVFELEREGVRAIASCGGNSDDAALGAKRFLTAHPRAPVAMRVSAACAAQLMKR